MSRRFNDQHIREYLLGDMTSTEEREFEIAFFGDADLLGRVELARDDLADDYVALRLSDVDREKVERRLFAGAEGRQQLAIARALRNAATQRPSTDDSIDDA